VNIPADEGYCYLTTTGRTSGEPREIEIWYGLVEGKLYMLSGSGEDNRGPKAHWVRNLLKTPALTVRVKEITYTGTARVVERETREDAVARKLLVDLNDMGLPCGTEALDPITPQYLGDLIAWSAIGARTTESQTHREMASGLSSPVGFKNGTDGSLDVALNAMLSAAQPHAFLGINGEGQVALTQTRGNAFGHLILRGGATPNYDSVNVAQAEAELVAAKLPANIVVDCSHGNSRKNHALQSLVLKDVVGQLVDGCRSIKGLMLESNLFEGNQKLGKLADLRYGVSITDACLGWEATANGLHEAAQRLKARA
jgi:3-deoxy-7-phosphoheptulonate synthase